MTQLRGWKAIAHHLGVSESTVIRWANNPDFPVVRGKKGATIYAHASQLDAWMQQRGQRPPPTALPVEASISGEKVTRAEPLPTTPASVEPPAALPSLTPAETGAAPLPSLANVEAPTASALATHSTRQRISHFFRLRYVVPVALIVLAGITAIWLLPAYRIGPTQQAVSPATRQAYLDARAQWATRTPQGIASAIRQFQSIIAHEPNFAPAFSGLADAYILNCEFAGADRQQAFAAAEKAARTALALQPDAPAANRILGFLIYWTTRDIDRARPYFKKALAADDRDYLIQLWYGNALIDALKVDEGLTALDRAAELGPDVPAVRIDRAVAQWQAGQSKAALAALTEAERSYPDLSAPSSYLALFALARGDAAAYLDHAARWATRIGDQQQAARIAAEQGIFTAGGDAALWRFMAQQAPILSSSWHGGYLAIAISASLAGDREKMVAILDRPDITSQNWRPLRFPVEAFLRWKNDADVAAKLDHAFNQSPFDAFVR